MSRVDDWSFQRSAKLPPAFSPSTKKRPSNLDFFEFFRLFSFSFHLHKEDKPGLTFGHKVPESLNYAWIAQTTTVPAEGSHGVRRF